MLRHVLPLLAIMGLLLAPIARSASAMSATHSEPAAAAAEDATASMPQGMPCCPDEAPASDCAKGCPLMAICMSPFMQSVPGSGLPVPQQIATVIAPDNDASPDRLGQPPPGRPPKT